MTVMMGVTVMVAILAVGAAGLLLGACAARWQASTLIREIAEELRQDGLAGHAATLRTLAYGLDADAAQARVAIRAAIRRLVTGARVH